MWLRLRLHVSLSSGRRGWEIERIVACVLRLQHSHTNKQTKHSRITQRPCSVVYCRPMRKPLPVAVAGASTSCREHASGMRQATRQLAEAMPHGRQHTTRKARGGAAPRARARHAYAHADADALVTASTRARGRTAGAGGASNGFHSCFVVATCGAGAGAAAHPGPEGGAACVGPRDIWLNASHVC